MNKFFGFLADTITNAERGILDFLGAFVPYAVPIIPAYLTYYHTKDMMGFPSWVAFTAAFVVETLGMTSVSTAIKFYRNNQQYKSGENKAPFALALFVYLFYLVVVLSVNVLLEWVDGSRSGYIILAIALFTMLSVPSGVLISIRAQYREILDEREERKAARNPKQEKQGKPKHASDYKDKILEMVATEFQKSGKLLTPKEVTMRLGLDHDKSKGYVSTQINTWAKDKQKPPSNPMTF